MGDVSVELDTRRGDGVNEGRRDMDVGVDNRFKCNVRVADNGVAGGNSSLLLCMINVPSCCFCNILPIGLHNRVMVLYNHVESWGDNEVAIDMVEQ